MSERVEQVLDDLDPTPAHEAAWPVSRRQTLRALASVGALAAVPGASAQSAGTVIADEATFSNYGSTATASGYELTIEGETFAFDGDDTIGLPDGGSGTALVTPSGAEAREVLGPDGSVVFEGAGAIPDSAVLRYKMDEGSGSTLNDSIGTNDATITGATFVSNGYQGGAALSFDGSDDQVSANALNFLDGGNDNFTIAFTVDLSNSTLPATNSENIIHNTTSNEYLGIGPNGLVSDGIAFDIRDSSGNKVEQDGISVGSFSGLIRVCLVWSASSGSMTPYVNNSEQSKSGGTTNTSVLSNGLYIGNNDNNNPFSGVIDDVIFYDSSLSSSEVEQDYNLQPFA